MRRIYEAHLATEPAQRALSELADLVGSSGPLCLLCFERQPEHCHRRIVAEHLARRLGCEVVDLLP
jgi:uncharacterized protein (DUF488 family)